MEQNDVTEIIHHVPVLAREVEKYLALRPGDCVIDGTLGFAGHAQDMAVVIGPKGHLIGFDRDSKTLALAEKNLADAQCRLDLWHSNFCEFDEVLKKIGVNKVNAMLLDLGVSSMQLDEADRGFSFLNDGPLDMRMDQDDPTSAFDIINTFTQEEIANILKVYGQERFAKRIASFIIAARDQSPITTTKQLSDIIVKATPARFRHGRLHVATRSFQAIRIAVNRELDMLELTLKKCPEFLAQGARLAIISFHSLEDRMVKHTFRQWGKEGWVKILTKKPIIASDEEIKINARSRSAKLRVVEKIV